MSEAYLSDENITATFHVEYPALVPNVTFALELLEAAYNLLAVSESENLTQDTVPVAFELYDEINRALESEDNESSNWFWISAGPGRQLRVLVSDLSTLLEVDSVRRSGSFDISLSGLGKAIVRLIDALDPATWKERKLKREKLGEEIRHAKTMNAVQEQTAQLEADVASFEKAIAVLDTLVAKGVLTQEQANERLATMLRVETAVLDQLVSNGVKPAIESGVADS